jgi:hypothetical protein
MKKLPIAALFSLLGCFSVFAGGFEFTTGIYGGGLAGPKLTPGEDETHFSFTHLGWNLQLGFYADAEGNDHMAWDIVGDFGFGYSSRGNSRSEELKINPDIPLDFFVGAVGEFFFLKPLGVGLGAGYSQEGAYIRGEVPLIWEYGKLALSFDYFVQHPDHPWRVGALASLRGPAAAAVLEFLGAWFS